MVIDHLRNILIYGSLGRNFQTAVRWLSETDLSQLSSGKTVIDGENVLATLSDLYLDRPEPAYEVHHQYADIQLVLSGQERFYLGWDGKESPAAPGSDFFPCQVSRGLPFTLEADQFVIFLPGEPHAPGNPDTVPGSCKKLVIKVRV